MAKCSLCHQDMLITDGCSLKTLTLNGIKHLRYIVGEKDYLQEGNRCGDCGAKYGSFHHLGCDIEQCPVCNNQLISCDCEFEELCS